MARLAIVSVGLFVSSLLATPTQGLHVFEGSAASIADLGAVASSADELSSIYEAAAKELPSQEEQRKALSLENAAALGTLGAEHAAELSKATRKPCGGCSPDAQDFCPLDWSKSGNACAAPASYTGPCASIVYTEGFTVQDKIDLEAQCQLCWRCSSAGVAEQTTLKDGPISEGGQVVSVQ